MKGALCDKNERIDVIQSMWALPSLLNHTSGPLQEPEYQRLLRLMLLIIRSLCRWWDCDELWKRLMK